MPKDLSTPRTATFLPESCHVPVNLRDIETNPALLGTIVLANLDMVLKYHGAITYRSLLNGLRYAMTAIEEACPDHPDATPLLPESAR